MIRRIIVADDESMLDGRHAGPGESLLIADWNGADLFAARAAVKAATGVDPPDHACAVVDPKDGLVVAVICADPTIDAVEGRSLVAAYPGVFEGCTYDKVTDTFTAPVVSVPAGVDHFGKPIPAKEIGGPVPKQAVAASVSGPGVR